MFSDLLAEIVARARFIRPKRAAKPRMDRWCRQLRVESLESRRLLTALPTVTTVTVIDANHLLVVVAPQNPPGAGAPTGSVELYENGTDAGPTTLSGGSATINIAAWLRAGNNNTVEAVYSGDQNYAASSADPFVPPNPLATYLNPAQFYGFGWDTSQESPFNALPYSAIPNNPGYAWVAGFQYVLISVVNPSINQGIVQQLTVTVNGAENWNYQPTLVALDTTAQTALYQLNQPVAGPEKLLVTASIGSNVAYFRLDTLPGDFNGNGTLTAADVAQEQAVVNSPFPLSDTYDIWSYDINGDGADTQADVAFIQNEINAGETQLPAQLVISRQNGNFETYLLAAHKRKL